jgi:hypothetical protein
MTSKIPVHLPDMTNETTPHKRTNSPMYTGGIPIYAHAFPIRAYPRSVRHRKVSQPPLLLSAAVDARDDTDLRNAGGSKHTRSIPTELCGISGTPYS